MQKLIALGLHFPWIWQGLAELAVLMAIHDLIMWPDLWIWYFTEYTKVACKLYYHLGKKKKGGQQKQNMPNAINFLFTTWVGLVCWTGCLYQIYSLKFKAIFSLLTSLWYAKKKCEKWWTRNLSFWLTSCTDLHDGKC